MEVGEIEGIINSLYMHVVQSASQPEERTIENIWAIVLNSLPGDEEMDLMEERRQIPEEKSMGRRITH